MILLPSKKIIGRPLNLLYPIECSEKEKVEDKKKREDQPVTGACVRSQPRRLAAVRIRQHVQQQLNDDMTDQDKLTCKKLILTMNTRHFVVVGVL